MSAFLAGPCGLSGYDLLCSSSRRMRNQHRYRKYRMGDLPGCSDPCRVSVDWHLANTDRDEATHDQHGWPTLLPPASSSVPQARQQRAGSQRASSSPRSRPSCSSLWPTSSATLRRWTWPRPPSAGHGRLHLLFEGARHGRKPLTVREALALINQTLDEALAEQEGDSMRTAGGRWRGSSRTGSARASTAWRDAVRQEHERRRHGRRGSWPRATARCGCCGRTSCPPAGILRRTGG